MSFLKPDEVAKAIRVSVQTVRRLIRDGKLPATVVGKQVRIAVVDFDNFMKSKSHGI